MASEQGAEALLPLGADTDNVGNSRCGSFPASGLDRRIAHNPRTPASACPDPLRATPRARPVGSGAAGDAAFRVARPCSWPRLPSSIHIMHRIPRYQVLLVSVSFHGPAAPPSVSPALAPGLVCAGAGGEAGRKIRHKSKRFDPKARDWAQKQTAAVSVASRVPHPQHPRGESSCGPRPAPQCTVALARHRRVLRRGPQLSRRGPQVLRRGPKLSAAAVACGAGHSQRRLRHGRPWLP